MITIDDFHKVEIKIGTVLEATKVPEADRLIKLVFDFGPKESKILNQVQDDEPHPNPLPGEGEEKDGERDIRQIMSAIAEFYPNAEDLVGKQIAVCVNLEPRKFKGYESQGMILATGDDVETISFLIPEKKVKPGSMVH